MQAELSPSESGHAGPAKEREHVQGLGPNIPSLHAGGDINGRGVKWIPLSEAAG